MTILLGPASRRFLSVFASMSALLALGACVVVPVPSGTARESSMLVNAQCGEGMGAEFDRAVDSRSVDATVAQEAMRIAINAERCRRSLKPLGPSSGASGAASGHAGAMAQYAFMGHNSPVRGRETFARRLEAERAQYDLAGENVARTSLYALGREPFEVVDSSRCMFRRATGQPIGRRSYRALANHIVQLWMSSPDHKRNMLHPEYRRVGTGLAIRPDRGRCGEVFAAAVFMG